MKICDFLQIPSLPSDYRNIIIFVSLKHLHIFNFYSPREGANLQLSTPFYFYSSCEGRSMQLFVFIF
jgi:hypothetical protein